MTFSEKLKQLRLEKGLSLQALSDISDVTAMTLFNIEHNRTKPNVRTISKLAKALDYDYSELFDIAFQERKS